MDNTDTTVPDDGNGIVLSLSASSTSSSVPLASSSSSFIPIHSRKFTQEAWNAASHPTDHTNPGSTNNSSAYKRKPIPANVSLNGRRLKLSQPPILSLSTVNQPTGIMILDTPSPASSSSSSSSSVSSTVPTTAVHNLSLIKEIITSGRKHSSLATESGRDTSILLSKLRSLPNTTNPWGLNETKSGTEDPSSAAASSSSSSSSASAWTDLNEEEILQKLKTQATGPGAWWSNIIYDMKLPDTVLHAKTNDTPLPSTTPTTTATSAKLPTLILRSSSVTTEEQKTNTDNTPTITSTSTYTTALKVPNPSTALFAMDEDEEENGIGRTVSQTMKSSGTLKFTLKSSTTTNIGTNASSSSSTSSTTSTNALQEPIGSIPVMNDSFDACISPRGIRYWGEYQSLQDLPDSTTASFVSSSASSFSTTNTLASSLPRSTESSGLRPLTKDETNAILQDPTLAESIYRARNLSALTTTGNGNSSIPSSSSHLMHEDDLLAGLWTKRVIHDTDTWLARRTDEALGLGVLPPIPPPSSVALPSTPSIPSSSITAHKSETVPKDDIHTQALFGFGEGNRNDILRTVGMDTKNTSLTSTNDNRTKAGTTVTGTTVNGTTVTENNIFHLKEAKDFTLHHHHHGRDEWLYWHRDHPLPTDSSVDKERYRLTPPGQPVLPLVPSDAVFGAEGGEYHSTRTESSTHSSFTNSSFFGTSTTSNHNGMLDGALSLSSGGVKVAANNNAGSSSSSSSGTLASIVAGGKVDLSLSQGEVVLFEYAEPRPLFQLHSGMVSRIVTYYRALTESEVIEEMDPESGGMIRRSNEAPEVEFGSLEILRPQDPFPLIGGLEPGASMMCIVNNLYRAPIFPHTVPETDFLVIVKQEKASTQMLNDPRIANVLQSTPSSSTLTTPPTTDNSLLHRRRLGIAYLREIKRIFVVGQLQPREVVFVPMFRGPKGLTIYDGALSAFLRGYAAWHLLSLIAEEDRQYTLQLKREGRLPLQHEGVKCGMISARRAFMDFDFAPDMDEEEYIRMVEHVVSYDERNHTFTQRDPSFKPVDALVGSAITQDRLALYESMRSGLAILRACGVRTLRLDDGSLDNGLRKLQTLYDEMVRQLMRVDRNRTVDNANGNKNDLWEYDGGVRRLRRTVDIAQAIVYALAQAPWAVTANVSAFHKNDMSSLSLQDPHAVGDPSERGEFLSFINEKASRGIRARLKLEGIKGNSSLNIEDEEVDTSALARKEGTERDLRSLSISRMTRMLMEYGMPIQKIKLLERWEMVDTIRSLRTAAAVAQGKGSGSINPAGGSSIMYAGDAKLAPRDRQRIKADQAKEIMRRHTIALSQDTERNDEDDEEEDDSFEEELTKDKTKDDMETENNFAAELEKLYGNKPTKPTTVHGTSIAMVQAIARKKMAEDDERAEFEMFKQQLKQGSFFNKTSGTKETNTSTSSGSTPALTDEQIVMNALASTFPGLPLALFRPPHAPIVASHWDRMKAAENVASNDGNGSSGSSSSSSTSSSSSSSSSASSEATNQPSTADLLLVTGNRDGALHPLPVTRLTKPALDGPGITPEWFQRADGSIGARGKVLRVVRTVIDEAGVQRVYVTYTVNRYAVMQAWLKRARGIDLGSIGPPKELARDGLPDVPKNGAIPSFSGYGLVSTGFFRPRAEKGVAAKRVIATESASFRARYSEMQELGFLPRNRKGKVLHRIFINGNPVAVCKQCQIWGHKGKFCPFARGNMANKAAATKSEAEVNAHIASIRQKAVDKVVATLAGKGLFRPTAGVPGGGGNVVPSLTLTSGGAKPVPTSAVGTTTLSNVGTVTDRVPVRRRKDVLPEPSAARKFAFMLEEKINELTINEIYSKLWDIADPVKYPYILKNKSFTLQSPPMDIRTLRMRIIARTYRDFVAFLNDAQCIYTTACIVAGDNTLLAKAAKKFLKELREFSHSSSIRLRNAASAVQAELGRTVLPTAERLLLQLLAQPGFTVPQAELPPLLHLEPVPTVVKSTEVSSSSSSSSSSSNSSSSDITTSSTVLSSTEPAEPAPVVTMDLSAPVVTMDLSSSNLITSTGDDEEILILEEGTL